MKIKYALIITGLAVLLMLSGCGSEDGTDSDSGDTVAAGKRFIGGSLGLTVEFLDGAPPEEAYDGGGHNFGASVKVVNEGETDVSVDKAELELTGFRPADFNVDPETMLQMLNTDLNGKDMDSQGAILDGETDIVDFGSNFDYAGELSGNTNFPLKVSLCYEYGTRASANLCVEKDLLDPEHTTATGAVCDANSNLDIDASGGPIEVTDMKEQVSGGNKISFSFLVAKANTDLEIYSSEPADLCNDENIHKDVVWIDVNTGLNGDGEILSCTGLDGLNENGHDSGYMKLFGGQRTVNCIQDIPDGSLGDYTTEIKIEMAYDVKDYTEEKSILIRHI